MAEKDGVEVSGGQCTVRSVAGNVVLEAQGSTKKISAVINGEEVWYVDTNGVKISTGNGLTLTTASATALAVGLNGATNPALLVDASTASSATGVKVVSAAAAGGVAVSAISSGTNESMKIDAKGTGTLTLQSVASGNVIIGPTGKLVMAGTLTAGGLLTNAIQVATSGPLIYSGSGAPSISAAVQGSIYLRTDGSSTSTRLYVATNTSGTWTNVTTAA